MGPTSREAWEGQLRHALALAALLTALALAAAGLPGTARGALLGLGAHAWLALAVGVAVLHQLYVALAWRAELHHRALTRRFGPRAFALYLVPFQSLLLARPVVATLLALANRDTARVPRGLALGLALALAVPVGWLLVSVVRDFGFRRASGADHFDPSLRGAPLVRRGIFRLTPNAMYVFGFGLLWIPALAWRSQAALLAAAFQHAYIWVHFLCTERPDMRRLHGQVVQ